VLVLNAVVGDKGLVSMLAARRELAVKTAAVERQKAENDKLAEDARQLREDPDAIEGVARRELGLIRPGEKLFIVKPPEKKQPAPGPAQK
jgi:cell division protein FtsB